MSQQKPSRRWSTRLLILSLAPLIIMGLAIGKEFSGQAERVVSGKREVQIDVSSPGAKTIKLPPTLIVAHNAGDDKSTVQAALDHGAVAIEIDVRMIDGVLYAAHSDPPDAVPKSLLELPTLAEAWTYTAPAEVLKLDFKSTDQSALDALTKFIQKNPTDRQILIDSKDPNVLLYFESALPNTVGFYSVMNANEIDDLLSKPNRPAGIDGVTAPISLLTKERIQLLRARGYYIDAWSVNDVARMAELVSYGVDIITTDNLAFFEMQVATPVVADHA